MADRKEWLDPGFPTELEESAVLASAGRKGLPFFTGSSIGNVLFANTRKGIAFASGGLH